MNLNPEDYVIATGQSYSVTQFVEEAFNFINIKISWRGKGIHEIGYNKLNKKTLVKVDSGYFRPTDVNELRGDARKARKELGWYPKTNFKQLVKEMMESDFKQN